MVADTADAADEAIRTDKRWRVGAWVLFMANLPILFWEVMHSASAYDDCAINSPCRDEVVGAMDTANGFMWLSAIPGVIAMLIPLGEGRWRWRIACMLLQCVGIAGGLIAHLSL